MADLRFKRELRLTTPQQFQAVRAGGKAKYAGPLRVAGLANGLSHNRLGLAVSRRFGGAVQRNKVKRKLREAFRQTHHDWPQGFDLVVNVKYHEIAGLADYRRWLTDAVERLGESAR